MREFEEKTSTFHITFPGLTKPVFLSIEVKNFDIIGQSDIIQNFA
jgi:hypothetical protein